MAYQGNTLADYLEHDLNLLSIGLNPSIISVQTGLYFANPRNRFWRAFKQAGFIEDDTHLDKSIHIKLLDEYLIGFTDVVKRPTSSAKSLKVIDYRRDAPILRAKCEIFVPKYLWFHGKVALKHFARHAYGVEYDWQWGINEFDQIPFKIFLTPNPSSANAAYSLSVITDYYLQLREIMESS